VPGVGSVYYSRCRAFGPLLFTFHYLPFTVLNNLSPFLKIMRAADLPGRLPQAPSGRRSAARNVALDCVQLLTPFPRKSQRLFQNRERTPPPKLPLTAILSLTRFTLLSTLCCSELSLATRVPLARRGSFFSLLLAFTEKSLLLVLLADLLAAWTPYNFNTSRQQSRTIIARL
jgi:hypothetical protein